MIHTHRLKKIYVQDGTPGGMSNLPAAGAKTGGYVPPSLRNRAAGDTGDSMNKRREENSVRVTNLSEDTREDDLRVRILGPVIAAALLLTVSMPSSFVTALCHDITASLAWCVSNVAGFILVNCCMIKASTKLRYWPCCSIAPVSSPVVGAGVQVASIYGKPVISICRNLHVLACLPCRSSSAHLGQSAECTLHMIAILERTEALPL